MTPISSAIEQVRTRISTACATSSRQVDDVLLVAVSKTRSAAELRAAYAAGLRHFGENYLQEALPKIQALAGLDLCWHFIGPIQSNKTRAIAEHFDWVHSVDRSKIAQRLSDQRPAGKPPLNICIQINIDAEDSKQGIPLDDVDALATCIVMLPHLKLRGLMAIPAIASTDRHRRSFERLAEKFFRLKSRFPTLDTLSMGMSDDFETAIASGSTLVRIGTALFGPRQYSTH